MLSYSKSCEKLKRDSELQNNPNNFLYSGNKIANYLTPKNNMGVVCQKH